LGRRAFSSLLLPAVPFASPGGSLGQSFIRWPLPPQRHRERQRQRSRRRVVCRAPQLPVAGPCRGTCSSTKSQKVVPCPKRAASPSRTRFLHSSIKLHYGHHRRRQPPHCYHIFARAVSRSCRFASSRTNPFFAATAAAAAPPRAAAPITTTDDNDDDDTLALAATRGDTTTRTGHDGHR